MIKSPDCAASRRGLKWITSDYGDGATSSLVETEQISPDDLHLRKVCSSRPPAHFPSRSWCSGTEPLVAFGWTGRTLSMEFHASQTFFAHNSSTSKGVVVNSIPVVPGRLDPPAEGEKEEFVLKGKARTQTPHKYGANNLRNHRGTTQNTLIKNNNKRILKYSVWLRVKWLTITWTDRNWVWEKWKSGGVRFGGFNLLEKVFLDFLSLMRWGLNQPVCRGALHWLDGQTPDPELQL